MTVQTCGHLMWSGTAPHTCTKQGNCPNLYNDVYCPIKHLLYNCNHIVMEFATSQADPIAFHCGHPEVSEADWVCPVRGNKSVKCPLRANYK